MKLATRLECDGGCGATWREDGLLQPAVTGKRSDGMLGGGIPSGQFHLCRKCARVAFETARQYGSGVRADARANGPLPADLAGADSMEVS
jgi:hypothetical protein